eukprot:434291-Amphidinium_carterae.1
MSLGCRFSFGRVVADRIDGPRGSFPSTCTRTNPVSDCSLSGAMADASARATMAARFPWNSM